MRGAGWIPATLLALVTAGACGGRLAPLEEGKHDGGVVGSVVLEAGIDAEGDGSSLRDGPPVDERGPPPMAVCTAQSRCVLPEGGLWNWTDTSVIKCQAESYPGPWNLLLERLMGTTFQVVQMQAVQEPGFGFTFYDMSPAQSQLTYRVCVVEDDSSVKCASPITTQGPVNCACEPTSCWLQTACNTLLDDGCNDKLTCGACTNGTPCNPENNTCCPAGFMSDGWGGCVCAPGPKCPLCRWDTTTCRCDLSCSG